MAGVHDATSREAALELAGKLKDCTQGKAVNQPTDDEKIRTGELNRRDFLKRVGYASALALGACGLGLALYDPKGPGPCRGPEGLDRFGGFYRPAAEPRTRQKWPLSGARTGR